MTEGVVIAYIVHNAIGLLQKSMFAEYWEDIYDAYRYGGITTHDRDLDIF